jgi:16S rRNA (cytosine967-C5)-methyltransferase
MPRIEGLPARQAALRLLDAVLRRGQTLDAAAGTAFRDVTPTERALALAIAGEALRRLPMLDALIDSRTRQPLPDDSKARAVLRLALAQKFGLNVPDHALVATALPLVDGGPRRLVHGVLGALLRGSLDVDSRLPASVEERWTAAWGEPVVAAARAAILDRPPLDLAFKDDSAAASFAEQNGAIRLAPRHARLTGGAAVPDLPGFDAGDWWVQDLASSLPARIVPASARRVLDIAAAPGGKTMQLAAAGHDVTALDRSRSRLARLSDNLRRTGLTATVVAANALDWSPSEPFDAVLLDAPCSATGTFRRHPEVLYRARDSIIDESAALQSALLDRAADAVRPSGSLVYAVCSLEPAEGELQVDAFLGRHPEFALVPADTGVAGLAPSDADAGWLRTVPGQLADVGGLDGFFTAHLVRQA